jgi:hypothetical protein
VKFVNLNYQFKLHVWDVANVSNPERMVTTMSNSSRIEKATRDHVGATLTSEQITELVKISNPEWKGGVYPSDAAGKRQEDGTITFRGKVAYGDLVLEYLKENSFKVLPTEQIVRRPSNKKVVEKKEVAPPAPVAPTPEAAKKNGHKKQSRSIPVATKQKANDRHAARS